VEALRRSMSLMFPINGSPGGPGITSVISNIEYVEGAPYSFKRTVLTVTKYEIE
jgi:hypothetical protein